MLCLTLRGSSTDLYNGRLTSSILTHDRSGQHGCLIRLDHFGARFCRRAVQDCEQIHVMIRRRFSHRLFRADVRPISMDAIAVEVAWPRRYHRRCR